MSETLANLFNEMNMAGARLALDADGRVVVDSPSGAIGPALLEKLRDHREVLRDLLGANDAPRVTDSIEADHEREAIQWVECLGDEDAEPLIAELGEWFVSAARESESEKWLRELEAEEQVDVEQWLRELVVDPDLDDAGNTVGPDGRRWNIPNTARRLIVEIANGDDPGRTAKELADFRAAMTGSTRWFADDRPEDLVDVLASLEPLPAIEQSDDERAERLGIMKAFCNAMDQQDQAAVDRAWAALLDLNRRTGWAEVEAKPPSVSMPGPARTLEDRGNWG